MHWEQHLFQAGLDVIQVGEVLAEDDQLLPSLLAALQDVVGGPGLGGAAPPQGGAGPLQLVPHCQQLLDSLCKENQKRCTALSTLAETLATIPENIACD